MITQATRCPQLINNGRQDWRSYQASQYVLLALIALWLLLHQPTSAAAQATPCPRRPDLNHDGIVDAQDISLIVPHWGQSPARDPYFDLDSNGRIDIVDIMWVASAWQQTGPQPPRFPGGGQVWAEGSTRKIGRHDPAPDHTWVWDGCRVQLHAARNETEPFQLVIATGSQGLTGVTVVASDLISPTQSISPATISRDQITAYREAYFDIPEPSDPWGYGLPAGDLGAGQIPDALIPFEDPYNPDTPVGAPFDVPAGQNQPVWIDIAVPVNTPAGSYQGTISIIANQGTITLPLELQVWDFTLPEPPPLSINFTLDPFWTLPPQYEVPESDIGAIHALTDRYYEALAEHRLGPMDFYLAPSVSEANGQIQLDWSQADSLYAHWLDDHGLPAFYVPDIYDSGNDRYRIRDSSGTPYTQADFADPTFVAKASAYYAALRDHLVSQGWWDRALAYPTDETEWVADEPGHNGPAGYQRLLAWAQLLKGVDAGYRIMASSVYPVPPGPPDRGWPDLTGWIDDWNVAVQDADLDPALWKARQALGETLSFYHNDWGDFIDYRATLHRGLGWVAYKYGAWAISGWAAAAWIGNANTMAVVNPWTTPVVPIFGYGGGALFWPGHRIEGDPGLNIDGPLPSIRLKLAREAVEDYSYLSLLAAQTSNEYAHALTLGLVPGDYWDWNPAPEAIYFLRDTIGRLLDAGVGVPLATIRGQVTDNNGAPLAGVLVSGGLTAALTDASGYYTLTVSVPSEGIVELSYAADRYQGVGRSVSVSPGGQVVQDVALQRVAETVLQLYSFETAGELEEWEFDNTVAVGRSSEHATQGSWSLRVEFDDNVSLAQADRWPAAGVGTFPTADWSSYTYFEFDIFNASNYYASFDLYIVDSADRAYPQSGGTITLPPNSGRRVVIPLAAVAASGVDVSHIAWLEWEVETITEEEDYQGQTHLWALGSRTLFFDNLRLVRVNAPQSSRDSSQKCTRPCPRSKQVLGTGLISILCCSEARPRAARPASDRYCRSPRV